MIKTPVSELKAFLAKSSHIANSSIVPITDYIKLVCEGDSATLTKTNLQSFVVHQIEGKFTKNFSLLIDETAFNTAVSKAEGEIMKISFKDSKGMAAGVPGIVTTITLDDEVSGEIKCQGEKVELFPTIPEYDTTKVYTLTPDMVDALYVSASAALAQKKGVPMTWPNYVHIKNAGKKKCYIVGFNNMIMHFKSFKEEMPEMCLEPGVCTTIGGYGNGVNMYKGEKYNFFDSGKTLYGFVQSEVTTPDFQTIVGMMTDEKSFLVNRKGVISFCERAISLRGNYSLFEPCLFKNGEGDKSILFQYVSDLIGKSCKVELEVKKNKRHVIQEFLFNPADMVSLLKGLSVETIRMVGDCSHNFFILIEDDKDYVGAIRKIFLNDKQLEKKTDE